MKLALNTEAETALNALIERIKERNSNITGRYATALASKIVIRFCNKVSEQILAELGEEIIPIKKRIKSSLIELNKLSDSEKEATYKLLKAQIQSNDRSVCKTKKVKKNATSQNQSDTNVESAAKISTGES